MWDAILLIAVLTAFLNVNEYMVTRLSVNLNAIAYLRNRRDLPWPDLIRIGHIALDAGASGLTVHPRPDERHIRYTDIGPLAAVVMKHPGCEYNIEGYPDQRLLEIVEWIKPHQVTLVPDIPTQVTSDHGWDFNSQRSVLEPVIARLSSNGIRVSLFCDADVDMVCRAIEMRVNHIELYTGPYGMAFGSSDMAQRELDKLAAAADAALAGGLLINAGHDLTLDNIPMLIKRIPFINEMSIGHCLTADALMYGIEGVIQRYCNAMGHLEP